MVIPRWHESDDHLAYACGRLYYLNTMLRRVVVLDAETLCLLCWFSAVVEAGQAPCAIAAGPGGCVWVGDRNRRSICMYTHPLAASAHEEFTSSIDAREPLSELKRRAAALGLPEPLGNKSHEQVWRDAIEAALAHGATYARTPQPKSEVQCAKLCIGRQHTCVRALAFANRRLYTLTTNEANVEEEEGDDDHDDEEEGGWGQEEEPEQQDWEGQHGEASEASDGGGRAGAILLVTTPEGEQPKRMYNAHHA